jgi:hypothetical protein
LGDSEYPFILYPNKFHFVFFLLLFLTQTLFSFFRKVVQASAVALGYGDKFTAQERFLPMGYVGTKLLSIFALFPMAFVHCSTLLFAGILRLPVIGKKVAKLVPPGSGLPDWLCDMGSNCVYCKVDAVVTDTDGTKKTHTGYSYLRWQGDAGNAVTAQCISEAALALVYNRDKLPKRSDDGFGTPAELLGDALLERFNETKVRPVEVKGSFDAPIL